MRQSSNDLTNMVRLFLSTGEPGYRDHCAEILASRADEGGDERVPIVALTASVMQFM